MRELVDLLAGDADMLPCEAAERISIRRIAARESDRTAGELMDPIPTVNMGCDVQAAARTLVESGSAILAVVSSEGKLVGVVTEWDVTRATASGQGYNVPLADIMTQNVIFVSPEENILTVIQKLEHHEISAMPVVEGAIAKGVISADILARRSLLRLLQSQVE